MLFCICLLSHPARGGWIEIGERGQLRRAEPGPTPHGVGGLKWAVYEREILRHQSHPARGGWIEIKSVDWVMEILGSPTPHGVGGLKSHSHPCIQGNR